MSGAAAQIKASSVQSGRLCCWDAVSIKRRCSRVRRFFFVVALTLKAVIAFGVEFRETRAKWGAMRDRERPIFGLLIASDGDKCADLADGQSALAFLALSYACEPIPCLSHA